MRYNAPTGTKIDSEVTDDAFLGSVRGSTCERGGSKFQGRQKTSKGAFNNDFRAWLGLGTLEILVTHPPIAKYGTKKQLAK